MKWWMHCPKWVWPRIQQLIHRRWEEIAPDTPGDYWYGPRHIWISAHGRMHEFSTDPIIQWAQADQFHEIDAYVLRHVDLALTQDLPRPDGWAFLTGLDFSTESVPNATRISSGGDLPS